ncbi:MAG: sigma-70 family RNA polymerase sigma factor [Clostridia bacterium]|nr:sigma-70 family RNA polymerase sigma factor [Clostridia bacterium]
MTDFVENYENLSDNEIVTEINGGNYELMRVIIERYYSVVIFNVRKYCSEDFFDDAVQEANLALYTAVKSYEPQKSAFSTFATLCIKRALFSMLKQRNGQKNIPKELISSIEETEIVDINSPEKLFIEKESLKTLKNNIQVELSALEYKVLQLFLNGESYSDISKKLGISQKSVDNSLTRIRKKLKFK